MSGRRWGGGGVRSAHTLPPSYLQCLHLTPNIMLLRHTWHVCDSHDLVENLEGREEGLKEGAGPGGGGHAHHSPVRHGQADVSAGGLRGAPVGVCGGEPESDASASANSRRRYGDSRSSVDGVGGTGPGVPTDGSPGSSGPVPQPLS